MLTKLHAQGVQLYTILHLYSIMVHIRMHTLRYNGMVECIFIRSSVCVYEHFNSLCVCVCVCDGFVYVLEVVCGYESSVSACNIDVCVSVCVCGCLAYFQVVGIRLINNSVGKHTHIDRVSPWQQTVVCVCLLPMQ